MMNSQRKTRNSTLLDSAGKKKAVPQVINDPKLNLKKRLSALSKTSRVTEAVKEQIEDRCSVS